MNAPNGNAFAERLRRWWLTPPRPGLQRLIYPWEYRHLRAFAAVRLGGAVVLALLAVITFSLGGSDWKTYGWTAFWLVLAALSFAGGYWELTIARSAPPRT